MNKRKVSRIAMMAAMTALLASMSVFSFAAADAKAKPKLAKGDKAAPTKPSSEHLAKKAEMVRKQKEQRITPEKRKAAAERLKAERQRVYDAKQAVKQATPPTIENK